MASNKNLISDSGIFQRYNLIDESMSLEEAIEKIEKVEKQQNDIEFHLTELKELASLILKEEGYGQVTHFNDINLSQLKDPSIEDESPHELVEKMSTRARVSRDVFLRFFEMERLSPQKHASFYYRLGQLHTRLLMTEGEARYKKHKDAPQQGAQKRSDSYKPVKEYIIDKYNKIENKKLSISWAAGIIYKNITEDDTKNVPKLADITLKKIEYHLRDILKKQK